MMTAGYAYDETETTTIVTILHPYLGGHKLFIYPLAGKKKRSEKIHQLQVQHIVNLLVEPVRTFRCMGLTGAVEYQGV